MNQHRNGTIAPPPPAPQRHPLAGVAAEPPAQAAPVAFDAPATVRLTRPLKTHRGDLSEIVVRQPCLTDYIDIGDIDTFVATGVDANGTPTGLEAKTAHQSILAYAVRLTGIDALVLGAMHPADAGNLIRTVRMMVLPFSRGNSSTGSMSSSST